ncbi:MAG: hypothetical protein WDM85_10250 [Caulobacteraceae bacterium]
MHWLDAFPPPVDSYIDALASTIGHNLKRQIGASEAAVATPGVRPAPAPQPSLAPAVGALQRPGLHPGLIVGGALAGLFLILLIVIAWPRAPNPAAAQATNTVMQALANSIAKNADDDDDDDRKPAEPAVPNNGVR